jgi:tetratricopeptide (TPR) repeat protein
MATFEDAIRKLQHGQLKEGQQILETLLERDPANPDLLYNLGMCYSEQGLFEKSLKALKKCVAIAPDYVNAYAALGFSYEQAGQGQEAIKILEQGLERNPKNYYILKNLGAMYVGTDQLDKAIECLEIADEVMPGTPEILYGLAVVYEQKGMVSSADLMYKRVIEESNDPKFVQLAEEALTRIGMETLKSVGLRYDAVMYCLGALEKFTQMGIGEVQRITFEIGLLGQGGLDINNPQRKYTLDSMPGEFTGLQLLCTMYTGFQMIDPAVDVGADLSKEYQAALAMFEKGGQ